MKYLIWMLVLLMWFVGIQEAQASQEPHKPKEFLSNSEKLEQSLVQEIDLTLRLPKAMFEDDWREYKTPLESYDVEYRGLRGLIYRQIENAARKFAYKQLRANRENLDGFAYEKALREDLTRFTGFGRAQRVVGERYKIAQVGQVQLYNDGKLKWDKDADEIVGLPGLQELVELPEIQALDIKARFAVTAKIKLDNFENSEVGATVKMKLPWGVKARMQGAVRGDGYAEASFQVILWQG